MNRYLIILAAAVTSAVCLLAGCSSTQDADPVETQPSVVETTTLNVPNETLAQGQGQGIPPWETTQPQTTDGDSPFPPVGVIEPSVAGEEIKPTVIAAEETKPSAQEIRPAEQNHETVVTVPSDETQQTQTQQTEPAGQTEPKEPVLITYEEFLQMDNYQQQAYYETFPDMQSYLNWFNNAVAEYEKEHPPISAGDGGIDLDEIIGGK